HAGEGWVRKDRKQVMPVAVDALAQRVEELLFGPAADAVSLVRGDIGAVEGAEGRRQRPPAGQRLTAAFGVGVAAGAVGRLEQQLAALERRLVRRLRRRCANQQESRGKGTVTAHRRPTLWSIPAPPSRFPARARGRAKRRRPKADRSITRASRDRECGTPQ